MATFGDLERRRLRSYLADIQFEMALSASCIYGQDGLTNNLDGIVVLGDRGQERARKLQAVFPKVKAGERPSS